MKKGEPLSGDPGKSCITIFALSNPLPFDPHNIPHCRNYFFHLMPNSLSWGHFLTSTWNNLKLLPPDYSDSESSLVWRNTHFKEITSFPWWLRWYKKESACSAGDPVSITESGRSSEEGNGYAPQYSCLENSMDRGVWWATIHRVAKGRTRLSN